MLKPGIIKMQRLYGNIKNKTDINITAFFSRFVPNLLILFFHPENTRIFNLNMHFKKGFKCIVAFL